MNRLTENIGLYGNEFEYIPTEIAEYKGDDKLIHTNNQMIYNKLGKIEDILEKYGIDSAEELDTLINIWKLRDVVDKMEKPINNLYEETGILDIEQDRDTWKKACELACSEISCENCQIQEECEKCGDCIYVLSNHFYQQAQKEMKDDR